MIDLILGDCLEKMKNIPDGSVDLILTDPPYGTTACKWDSVIPLEPMWAQLKRIIKSNGAIVMTASQPFTTTLIASNMKMFKYCWVWKKSRPMGFLQANYRPLKAHEDVCVFSHGSATPKAKNNMVYNPQGLILSNKKKVRRKGMGIGSDRESQLGEYVSKGTNYPQTIIEASGSTKSVHPTQKPVALMEYLIKTYTREGETVLDFTMGSGTTGVACVNTGRNFIGIEMDEKYFEIAKNRIETHSVQPELMAV
jgi:site-specific DNA-methyltransferase (adenine-specific)